MRKTMKYLFIAACFTLSIFMISGAVNAAPAISRETYETKQGSITDAEWPIKIGRASCRERVLW